MRTSHVNELLGRIGFHQVRGSGDDTTTPGDGTGTGNGENGDSQEEGGACQIIGILVVTWVVRTVWKAVKKPIKKCSGILKVVCWIAGIIVMIVAVLIVVPVAYLLFVVLCPF